MSTDEPFLARWSRRKVEAREQPAPDSAPAPQSELQGQGQGPGQSLAHGEPVAPVTSTNLETATSTESLRAELPSLDSLRGLQSDYHEFLKPGVDPGAQRAALKKLFSDPHFNRMDGLDVYIDDYGKFEPMSAAISASLAANKYLRVVDHLLSEDPAKKAEARAREAIESDPPSTAIAYPERAEEVAPPAPADPAIATPDTNETQGADGTIALSETPRTTS